jgi:hypothetical protein
MSEEKWAGRIVITPRAARLLQDLKQRYGAVLFHQSGGCCDGSVPLCLRQEEFRIGARDVLLGTVEGTPFYVDEFRYRYLSKEPLVLDAVPSQADSFSLESSDGMRFTTESACPAPQINS